MCGLPLPKASATRWLAAYEEAGRRLQRRAGWRTRLLLGNLPLRSRRQAARSPTLPSSALPTSNTFQATGASNQVFQITMTPT
jgi:hypothetical protein